MTAWEQSTVAPPVQCSNPRRVCRTPIVTRVLHQGKEVPKEKSLQSLVNEILSQNALHQEGEPIGDISGDEITEAQSSASTLTLHVECEGSGEREQIIQATICACAQKFTPRSSRTASSQPLSAMARHYANFYFDAYWKRTPDGAPCRYTDADCWQPGVQAAVISTMTQLREQGTCTDAAPILAFMQDKAVRQYGEVKNGQNFKRPPSMRCMARYRAIAATWLQTYSQHQVAGTLPADVHAILCSGDALHGSSWKADAGIYQLSRSQSAPPPAAIVSALEAPMSVLVNPFLAGQGEAFEDPFTCPGNFEPLSPFQASNELEESLLASMVAELLSPEGDLPSSVCGPQGAALPDIDPMSEYDFLSGYESDFLQQPCQSNKRKRCFSAAD